MTYAAVVVLQLPLLDRARMEPFVEACIRDKVGLIAIVGHGCERIEDDTDAIIVGDGCDESRFIVTSSHPGETLEEVWEFASHWPEGREGSIQLVRL